MAVGGMNANVTATTAILDSGTTAILVSQADAIAIHAVRSSHLSRVRDKSKVRWHRLHLVVTGEAASETR